MMTDIDQRWLTAAEVARRLGLDARTVRGMVRDGRIPGVWLGARTMRIGEAALAEYLGALRRSGGGAS